MAKVTQRSFSGGEWSPSLYPRADVAKYQTAARTLRNMITLRGGGAVNRPGTTWCGPAYYTNKTVRMVDFVESSTSAYIVIFSDLKVHFMKNGSYVFDNTKLLSGATQANPGVFTTSAVHGFLVGDLIRFHLVGGMTQLNFRYFKVKTVPTTSTFTLYYMDGSTVVDTSAFGAWTSGGVVKRVFNITTNYVEADLPTIKFFQNSSQLISVHPNYAPSKLTKISTADDSWLGAGLSLAPVVNAPTAVGVTPTAGPASTGFWAVTAVDNITGEESLPVYKSESVTPATPGTGASAVTISWTAPAVGTIAYYNVYRAFPYGIAGQGFYGLIGATTTTTFVDTISPTSTDVSISPPVRRFTTGTFGTDGSDLSNTFTSNPLSAINFQQRLLFGGTVLSPDTVFCSETGHPFNFNRSYPINDGSAFSFKMIGKQLNKVKDFVDIGNLIVFTETGEHVVDTEVLTPSTVAIKQISSSGISNLRPLLVTASIIFIQNRGSVPRELVFNSATRQAEPIDLSTYATHLFDGYTIVDWALQKVPNHIIWAVRSDGVLLGLTYNKEQEIMAWHHHDTDGTVENVMVIPEGIEDRVYITVKRTVGSATVRYIEALNTHLITDVEDAKFSDASLMYQIPSSSDSMTFTEFSGGGWLYTSAVTLTVGAAYFTSTAVDVGNEIHLTGSDGTVIRFLITDYVSSTVVIGKPDKTIPTTMRSVVIADWSYATKTIPYLWHLEGKQVSVLGDGFVVASPNNAAYTAITVTNGQITLPEAYSKVQVGLPYISDLETLDIDGAGPTMADRKKNISKVTVHVEKTRGLWVGAEPPTDDDDDPLEGLTEIKARDMEGYDEAVDLTDGTMEVIIRSEWNSNGRIFIRQVDPLPMSILAVTPTGYIPQGGT